MKKRCLVWVLLIATASVAHACAVCDSEIATAVRAGIINASFFPTLLEANVQQLSLEFARRGGEDLDLFKEFSNRFEVGVGVIDVKDHTVETPDMVAERIRKAAEFVRPERLFILPDCGCLHLPRPVAFAKLQSMVQGTQIVRRELEG